MSGLPGLIQYSISLCGWARFKAKCEARSFVWSVTEDSLISPIFRNSFRLSTLSTMHLHINGTFKSFPEETGELQPPETDNRAFDLGTRTKVINSGITTCINSERENGAGAEKGPFADGHKNI